MDGPRQGTNTSALAAWQGAAPGLLDLAQALPGWLLAEVEVPCPLDDELASAE